MKVYGLIHKDEDIRKHSTSGGAFSYLAEAILASGGSVYGACFDEHFHVVHRRITEPQELSRIRGVKYVQSKLGESYKQCKADLLLNRTVLFSGTPCQIAGLKAFLGELAEGDNLLLCDVICHGTPVSRVWDDYVDYLTKKYGTVTSITFRDKETRTWRDCKGTASIEGKTVSIEEYARLFYYHDIVRKGCFSCKYASLNRPGDITLGDFWGVENKHKEYDDNKGVSLVLCNTERGEKYLMKNEGRADIFESDLQGCRQPQLYKPTRKPFTYKYFWKVYNEKGIAAVIAMINNPFSMYSVARKVETTTKKTVKRLLKMK